MRLTFFLLGTLAFIISYAQETPSIEPHKSHITEIEKFSYLPKEGVPYLSTGFNYSTSKGSIKTTLGTVASLTKKTTSFNYTLGYGLSNYLAIGLSGVYPLNSQTEYAYGAGSTVNGTNATFKTSGWQEPFLALVWRIRDNEATKMRVHLSAGVSPKMQKLKSASATAEGNNGNGGTQFYGNLSLFKEVKAIEFQFQIERKFYSVVKSEDAADSTKTSETDQHQSTTFQIGVQGLEAEKISFGGNLIFTMTDKYSVANFANGALSNLDYDSSNNSALELFGKFKLEEVSMLQLRAQSILNASFSAKSGTTKLDQNVDSGSYIELSWIQEF